MPGIQVNWNIEHSKNMSIINNKIMENRKKIEHVTLKQFEHKNILFTSLGCLSTMIFLILATVFCLLKKRITITVRSGATNVTS